MPARGTRPTLDDDVRVAIEASSLGRLGRPSLDRLLEGAARQHVPAGASIRREGALGGHLELVITGFVRIFVTAGDGRTMTIRYVRPGDILGAVSVFRSPYRIPGSLQAIQDTDLLVLRTDVAELACAQDGQVARAFLDELSARVVSFVTEIPRGAFATVRQRVSRHLLDLASERQTDATLFAPISQQQLADAVGSVREVVVRVLREMREDGRIRTGQRGIEILDPQALWAEVTVDPGWNPGS